MYESPAYWDLKKHLAHFETMKRYIDLARTFRSLAYADKLTLSGTKQFDDEEISVTVSDSLRKDILEFAASRCEEVAKKIGDQPPQGLDVAAACKI